MNAQYEEAKAVYSAIRNEGLEAQYAHAELVIERLERRLKDFRDSVKWAKEDNRSIEFDCCLSNIVTSAVDGLAKAPKLVDEFSLMTKVIDALKSQEAAK